MESISHGKLNIKKHSFTEWIMLFILIFPFVQATLTQFLHIPTIINYLCDACLVLLLVKLVFHPQIRIQKILLPLLVVAVVSVIYVTINYFLNYQSVFYYIWGIRNNYRFYVAFFAFAILLKAEDAKRWFDFFDAVYIINFILVIVQFAMGYRQDFLGGIFGTEKGCNGGLLILLCIMSAKGLLKFMRGESSVWKAVWISVSSILLAALAEVKIYFILFALIMLLTALMTPPSLKKWFIILAGIVAISVLSTVLYVLYDEFDNFFNFENLWGAFNNTGYSTDEDIGRFMAIPIISKLFLQDFWSSLFGLGLGNTDFASIAVFNTPFFQSYGVLNYVYYTYAMLYLEIGLIGLSLYLGFFVAALVVPLVLLKRRKADSFLCQMAIIIAVIAVVFTVYNSSMRYDSACLIYFVLALPYISAQEKSENATAL